MKRTDDKPVTEKRLLEVINDATERILKTVNKNIEEAVGQIISAVLVGLADKADKKDINEVKADLAQVKSDLRQVKADVSDTKRRVIDLERDTPTQREVDELKKFVGFDKKYS